MKLQDAANPLITFLNCLRKQAFKVHFYFALTLLFPVFGSAQILSSPPADPEFQIPLRFDVLGDGVKMKPLFLKWDVSSPGVLQVGSTVIDDKTFFVSLVQAGKADARLNKLLESKEDRDEWLLVARWPQGLLQRGGVLEAFSKSGRVVWSRELKASDLFEWEEQLRSWKERYLFKIKRPLKQGTQDFDALPFWQTTLGVRNFAQEKQPFFTMEEPFRFCVSEELDSGLHSRLCTPFLVSEPIPGNKKKNILPGVKFTAVERVPQPVRVIAFNEVQPAKGTADVKLGANVQFFAETSNGISYDFLARPIRFNMVEMVKQPSGAAKITAWGSKPNLKVKELPRHQTLIERWVGPAWYQTIGDLREFWEFEFDPTKPEFDIAGEGGGLFTLGFIISKLPTEEDRPYLRTASLDGTYVDGSKFYVKAPIGRKLDSQMNSIAIDDTKERIWQWRFGAKESGEMNRSYVLVDNGKDSFRAYREIYRGYPGDISARISGIVTSSASLILLSELAGGYWFESVLGSSNDLLSRNRWGVIGSYFQSLTPLTFGPYTNTFINYDFALRYRFTPGLWSRDETWGAEIGSSYLDYDVFKAQFVGAGFFWGRSLPKVFDDLLNLVPYFRKPKFMDLEVIYYPAIVNPGPRVPTTLNVGSGGLGNWHLNIKGKIMWTKQFYTDASAGIKQLDFYQVGNLPNQTNVELRLTSFFGTFGFGYSF